MRFLVNIECDNAAFTTRPGKEVARLLRELAQRVSDEDPGTADVTYLPDVNGTRVLTARWIEPLISNYDPEERHNGYTNYPTFKVLVETENDSGTFEALLAFVRDLLRGVPDMTPQTVGVNIKTMLRSWVEYPDNRPPAASRYLLDDMRKIRWEHVNEEDLGESWLDTVRDLEEDQ